MRSVTLIVALACGCTAQQARTTRSASQVTLAAGLFGILGSIAGGEVFPDHRDGFHSAGVVCVPISLIAAGLFIAADGMVPEEEHVSHATRAERKRAVAWELTKQARAAARSRDCTQVQAIDPRVHDLDSDFYDSVFARDRAIQRCLSR